MSTENYTQKTLEAIRDAQSLAQEKNNQYLTPEHLLYALLKQDGGLIGSIFSRMGVDCNSLLAELDTKIDGFPKVSGGSGQVYASPETSKVLAVAEKYCQAPQDGFRVLNINVPDLPRARWGAPVYAPLSRATIRDGYERCYADRLRSGRQFLRHVQYCLLRRSYRCQLRHLWRHLQSAGRYHEAHGH